VLRNKAIPCSQSAVEQEVSCVRAAQGIECHLSKAK
jgi:hypothetical protein